MVGQVCVMCLKHESRTDPFCPDNPGFGCTYGGHHEYTIAVDAKPKQSTVKKIDKKLCTLCGLHEKNPLSGTNGCSHSYLVSGG